MCTRVLGMLVVAVLALAGLCASSAMAAFPGVNGQIAFSTDRDGDGEVYSMNGDGTDQTNVSNNPASDSSPSISPSGQRITFQSDRDDPLYEIYAMDADGTDQTRLTNDPSYDLGPQFSPDGLKIVFMSRRATAYLQIWIMDANGSNPVQLTNNTNGESTNPAFSPDGQKIVFESDRDGGQDEIYVMDANGTNQTRLTTNTASDTQATFSPDGQKIAFESTRDSATGGGPYEIYSMNPNGTSQTRLTNNAAGETEAAFSPDGTRIVFDSNRSGNYELWSMEPNGANPVNLTNSPTSVDAGADWGPCDDPPDGCDATETVSLTDSLYAVNEPAGQINVTVRRSNGLTHATTVGYATSGGSATAGSDYTPTSGTLTFAIGQNERTFSVPVTDDGAGEGDETFGVAVSNPSGSAQLVSPSSATVTIVDDDSPSPVARPDTSITSGPSGSTWVEQPQFGFASSIPGASFRCRTDGQVYAPCASPYTSARLTAGNHTFSVYAIGPSGAADPTPATRSFHVNSAETRRANCEVDPFQAVDNGRGTGDLDTTCEIYFGERSSCQAYKVCVDRPNDACPVGAICTLQTIASWNQVGRRYLAVAYANSRLEQTSPPLTVSGRFSQSCVTVTDCSTSDSQQALGRAPMVSTCSALVTVPRGPGYVQLPPRFKPSASAAAASLKLGCRATLKISPAPAYRLYPTAGKLTTFLPAAGRVTITPLSGKSSAAKKKKRGPVPAFRPIAASASRAGVVVLSPKLSKDAKRSLTRKRRLRVRVRVAFTPRSGGARVTRTQTITLKPRAKRPRRCVRHKRRGARPKACVPKRLR